MDFTPRWENNQEHSPCSTRHQPRGAQRQQGKQDVEFSAGISTSAGCAFHHAHSSAGTLTSLPLVLHPAGDIALTSPTPREPRSLRQHRGVLGQKAGTSRILPVQHRDEPASLQDLSRAHKRLWHAEGPVATGQAPCPSPAEGKLLAPSAPLPARRGCSGKHRMVAGGHGEPQPQSSCVSRIWVNKG